MPAFSSTSQERLNTCHKDIQAILNELIKIYDFSVIEGHRSLQTQQQYFKDGKSKNDGIDKPSKHQSMPSMAVDILPVAKDTNAFSGKTLDNARFYFMMGAVQAITNRLLLEGKITHNVRFGLDWDGDKVFDDQSFHDLPHFELV